MRVHTFLIGTLLILTGIIMFLINIDYISWDTIEQLFKFWPVLLIIIGISLFWGGRIPGWLAFILIIALVSGIGILSLPINVIHHQTTKLLLNISTWNWIWQ